MGRRGRSREEASQSDMEDAAGVDVVFLSSDEEANEDLTLEIVNKSRLRELKRKRAEDKERSRSFFEGLSASSAGEIVPVPSGNEAGAMERVSAHAEEEVKKKRKKRLKKKKSKEVEEEAITEQPEAPAVEVDSAGTGDSVIEVVDEASNNLVLRKLLRGPRYFDDSAHGSWESCYNCGEEGHIAANCKEERRQRPCFVCGTFGHTAKHCMQGQDCFICKRKGHHAKDCPHKHEIKSQEPVICLRCGYFGHDMASCKNNYATGDIKEIQCYICKKYGHLCCVDYSDHGPNQISCYNCAEPGHAGQGCAKQRGENNASTPSTLCYRCGQEGHFARGCTKHPKSSNRNRESSTPSKIKKDSKISKSFSKRNGEPLTSVSRSKHKKDKKDKDSKVSKSLPKNYGRMHRKESPYFDRSTKPVKSKVKGGWIVDDTVDLPKRTHLTNDWSSPYTPSGRGNQNYSSPSAGGYSCPRTPSRRTYNVHPASSGGRYSSPYTPHQRYNNYYPETPNSRGFTGSHHHGFSASRFGNSYDYYR